MKYATTLIIFLCSLSYVAQADPSSTALETPNVVYTNSLTENFEYYVHVLDRGFPIGQAKKKSDAPELDTSSLQTIASNLEQMNAALLKAYTDQQEKLLSQLPAAPQATQAPLPTTDPTLKTADDVMALSHDSLLKFFDCATRALSLLKTKSQMQVQGDLLELPLITSQIGSESGDGKKVGQGMACGRYLGEAALPTSSDNEDIKTLSAFLSRSGADRNPLLATLYLYSSEQRGVPLAYPAFWSYYWDLLRVSAVFTTTNLPTVAQATESFLSAHRSTFEIKAGAASVVLSEKDVRDRIQADWKRAEETVGGLL